MLVSILSIVVLLPIIILVLIGWGIYSLVTRKQASMHETHTKTKAVDVFLYVGILISLCVSVTTILSVIFEAVNRKFVDTLTAGSYVDSGASDVRFAIASLLVMFPIYVLLSCSVGKDIRRFPYKNTLLIRKAMIYLTMFVSLLTLAGALVSVIYTFLGGELSPRFWYKAVAVVVVALALFGYYFYSLKRDYSKKSFVPGVILVIASMCVIGSVVWSISIIGTPKEMRARRFDNLRLSDISRIQQEVFNRFQTSDKLPLTLAELNNAFQGYTVPTDPMSKDGYEYTVVKQPVVKFNYVTNKKEMIEQGVFELCATFDTVRDFNDRGVELSGPKGGVMSESFYSAQNYYYEGDRSPFWNHGIGKTCFKRIITPEMYYGR